MTASAGPDKPRHPWWDVNLHYLLPVQSLQLAGSLVNRLEQQDVRLVGDLAGYRRQSFAQIHGISLARLDEIDKALRAANAGPGQLMPAWQRQRFSQLRNFFEEELLAVLRPRRAEPPEDSVEARIASATTLEEELRALACWTLSERAAPIGMRYLGWDGKGGATLEQTASEVGLTRERVRQIQVRMIDRLEPLALRPPRLVQAAQALEAFALEMPLRAADVEYQLFLDGISNQTFRVEGILNAADAFGFERSFVLHSLGPERFLIRRGTEGELRNLLDKAFSLALSRGVCRLSALPFQGDARAKRAVLEQGEFARWLDREREWFWVPSAKGNPILNRVRQILKVVPEIALETLLAAVKSAEHITEHDLPLSVLQALIEQQQWSHHERGIVTQTDEAARLAVCGTVECCVFQLLAEHGGSMYSRDVLNECSRRGVSPVVAKAVCISSFLIEAEQDIYRVVGTKTAPEAVVDEQPVSPPPEEGRIGPSAGPPALGEGHRLMLGATVFERCDPRSVTFTNDAAIKLLTRAARLELGPGSRSWSLVELLLSPTDWELLRRWGQVGAIDFRMLGPAGHDAFGLVFTAYCAGIAKSQAIEGEMWPQIYEALGSTLRHSLFIQPGQPKQRVRDSMEGACRRYRLRHVFGSEGAQAWLRTVYLQFGLTDAGWRRLPWWLSGHGLPIAAHDLLCEGDPAYSQSFGELWRGLQECRWGMIATEETRSQFATNPWISSVGIDAALKFASSHREIERATEKPVPENESLLARPRLSWQGDDPCFEITLAAHLPDWMTAPRYILALGGFARLHVVRNADGDYELDGGPAVIAPEERSLPVDLLENGTSVLPECLEAEFYAAEEEIAAFDLVTGRKFSVWEPISSGRPCALLSAPDITFNPEPPEKRFMFSGRRQLSVYRKGLPRELVASIEGEPLWSPIEHCPPTAAATFELVARCAGGAWGDTAPVQMKTIGAMAARKLRVGNQVLTAVANEPGLTRFEPIALGPDIDAERRAVLETLRENQLRRTAVRFECGPTYGTAVESSGKWRVLRGTPSLDKADLTGRRWLIQAPASFNHSLPGPDDWAVLEGTNFCGRPRGVNREFHSLVHGFGQSLELGVGPYNQIGDHRIAVAKAITDCGSIKSVSRRDDRWTLEFRHSIEPETARVVAWTGSGLILLPDPAIEWNCSYCHVASSFFGAAPVAFGVSFEGFCVGTGLTEGPPFSQLCCVIECSEDWVSAASCLRWFHLPLLDPHIRHSVASRIAGNECRTICIWTGSGGPPSPALRQEDANRDRWQYAVRSFFERWRPCPNDAGALIRHFELLSGDPGRDLNDCWERYDEVLNIHPVLMAGIANLGIATIYPGYPQARGIFIEMLQNVCLDLPRTAGGSDRQRAEQEYLDEAARSMGVDPAFIQRSLLTDAWDLCSGTPVKTRNLRIALAIRPFRQWLAARLLSNDAEHAI